METLSEAAVTEIRILLYVSYLLYFVMKSKTFLATVVPAILDLMTENNMSLYFPSFESVII